MKKTRLIFIVLIILSLLISTIPAYAGEEEPGEEEYITCTFHAGEYGYFGDPEIKDKEVKFQIGETYKNEIIPDPVDDSVIFLGWALTPDAEEPDNRINIDSIISLLGTNFYAVWSDYCQVEYNVVSGYIMVDGYPQSSYLMDYKPGDHFQVLIPEHQDSQYYDFEGWYTGQFGNGVKYTEDTVITKAFTAVYDNWKLSVERTEHIELDKEYPLELNSLNVIFAFIPEETAVYEMYTTGKADDETALYIGIMDIDGHVLATHKPVDIYNSYGDVFADYELQAGNAYFFLIREMYNLPTSCSVTLHKAETAAVTFHANRDEQEDAWFDDDTSKTVKTILIDKGTEISTYKESGLTVKDNKMLEFVGWSVDPDSEWSDRNIIIDGDLDVYAIYRDHNIIAIDANGGIFYGIDGFPTVVRKTFIPGFIFDFDDEPRLDDDSLAFAGWSRDPDATVPDEDIIAGMILYDDIGDSIYAVYDEKVTEIFDANGGFFTNNPDMHTYQSTKGKGHVFYGMAVFNLDSQKAPLGWYDQNGVFIHYTTDVDPDYRVMEDSTYTTVWGNKIIMNSNGGYFPLHRVRNIEAVMDAEGVFDSSAIYDISGEPIEEVINYDYSVYLAGWATTPTAEEPDIIEGVTPVEGLTKIFAIWKPDSYYFVEGEHGVFEKGSSDGLKYIVKRKGDDRDTYPSFIAVLVDDEFIEESNYSAEEGSLILTLNSDYLDTLETGKHDITIHFNVADMTTDFTVTEKETETETESETETEPETTEKEEPDKPEPQIPADNNKPDNGNGKPGAPGGPGSPQTGDESNLVLWVMLLSAGFIMLAVALVSGRRKSVKK